MASPFQVRQRRYTVRKAAPYGDYRKALIRGRRELTEPAKPATRLRDAELSCNPERAPSYSEAPWQGLTMAGPGGCGGQGFSSNLCRFVMLKSRLFCA